MSNNIEKRITDSSVLNEEAYKTAANLNKRKALYEFTHPQHDINNEVLKLLDLTGTELLLDVGCGDGKSLLNIARKNPNASLYGIDISPGVFGKARSQAENEGLNLHFGIGDSQALPFAEGTFDRVTALHMLYHVPNIPLAVSEIRRVLSPEGLGVITLNSLQSKETLRVLKGEAAQILGVNDYPDTTLRVNLEDGFELLSQQFSHVEAMPYESRLILTDPQPYVDYFDSMRSFWNPYPSDEKWTEVLQHIKNRIAEEISAKGSFEELNLFGAFKVKI